MKWCSILSKCNRDVFIDYVVFSCDVPDRGGLRQTRAKVSFLYTGQTMADQGQTEMACRVAELRTETYLLGVDDNKHVTLCTVCTYPYTRESLMFCF